MKKIFLYNDLLDSTTPKREPTTEEVYYVPFEKNGIILTRLIDNNQIIWWMVRGEDGDYFINKLLSEVNAWLQSKNCFIINLDQIENNREATKEEMKIVLAMTI